MTCSVCAIHLAAFLDRLVNRGRHIRTDSMTGFVMELWAKVGDGMKG
jgi:hypothetical protein